LQYISLDGNSTTHELTIGQTTAVDDAAIDNPPSGTYRRGWCMRFGFAPGPSGTYTKPSSQARLVARSSGGQRIDIDTSGQLVLVLSTGSYTASVAVPDTTDDYQCELWCVTKDAAGADVDTQWVVRLIKVSDRTATTYINVIDAAASTSFAATSDVILGETTQRGAGFNPLIGPVYLAWEDADDPYGLIRVDRMQPDGIGHTDEWTGNAADVDESGTAVPDGDTTRDDVTFLDADGIGVTTRTQIYSLSAPLDIVSGDLLTGALTVAAWGVNPINGSKSSSAYFLGVLSDGTNDRIAGQSVGALAELAVYQGQRWYYSANPAGSALTQADLAGLQAGVRAETNSTSNVRFDLSAVTVTVPYQKDGETIDPVPEPPVVVGTPRSFGVIF
jgi:hypothetical protein